jgi:hypothetical protein
MMTCDCPVTSGDQHGFLRLIDEGVPIVAAVINDAFDGQFWRMNCQMFSWRLSGSSEPAATRCD